MLRMLSLLSLLLEAPSHAQIIHIDVNLADARGVDSMLKSFISSKYRHLPQASVLIPTLHDSTTPGRPSDPVGIRV